MSQRRRGGMATLRMPSMSERIAQLGYLLKHTFKMVGREPGIVRPTVVKAIYGCIEETVFFLGIFLLPFGQWGPGIGLILISVILYVYKYFFHARLESRQSWFAAQVVQGKSLDRDAAKARVAEQRRAVRMIALFNFIAKRIEKAQRKGKKGGLLIRLAAGAMLAVWDLASHYLLPAVVVDGYSVGEGIETMKRLKERVPETLMGVFGIDIAGHAVGTLLAPVYFVFFLVGVGLGFLVGEAVPAFYLGNFAELLAEFEPPIHVDTALHFSWLPLLIVIWLSKFGGIILERITTSVKVIYFTIFYMQISHPDRISGEMRDDLLKFIKLEE